MITKLTCCLLLVLSLFGGPAAWSARAAEQPETWVIRFFDEQGISPVMDEILLESGTGELPVPVSDDTALTFAGWALSPLREQKEKQTGEEPSQEFRLLGEVKEYQALTTNGVRLNLRPYVQNGMLSLYVRWKDRDQEEEDPQVQKGLSDTEPAEEGSESERTLRLEENTASQQGLPDQAEIRWPATERDEPWTIHFHTREQEVEDLVFHSSDRVNWPLVEEEGFLGWQIAESYQMTDQPVEGGFDPAVHLILPSSRLDFHVVEYADPSSPDLPAGLSTLTPFFQNRVLELDAVYANPLKTSENPWDQTSDQSSEREETENNPSEQAENRDGNGNPMEERAAAQSAYAIFAPSSGSLDFYWGVPLASTSAAVVIPFDLYITTTQNWPWLQYASSIKTATFHNQYTPYLFSNWFRGCSSLVSVQGTDRLNWSNCNSASAMFSGCSSLQSVDVSTFQPDQVRNFGSMFYGCSSLETLDVSNWNTSQGVVFSSMFMNCTALKSLDVSGFDVQQAGSLSALFRNCSSLSQLNVADWNVSSCSDFSGLFSGCSALQSLDVSKWDTSSATTLFMLFLDCTSLQIQGLENWKVDQVTTMNRTFNGVQNEELPLNSWNTSNNTSLEWCFGNVASNTIDVTDWDVSKVTTMASMCAMAQSLETLDVSRWQTDSLTTLEDAFRYASTLKTLDVSNWNTGKVNSLYQSFQYCSALQSLDVADWDTSSCTTLYCTFNGCTALQSIHPASWNTQAVTNMRWTFGSCSSLPDLDVSGWKTEAVQRMDHLFYDMAALESLDLSGAGCWNTRSVSDLQAMFLEDPKLSQVSLSQDFSFQGQAPQNLQAIFMDAPASAFGLEDPGLLPASLQGAWMCEKTIADTRLYAAPALLQKQYSGPSMAGTWVWARGGLLEIRVTFTGNNPALPESLEALLEQTDGYTRLDGQESLPPAELSMSASRERREWTARQVALENTSLYVSGLSALPQGYTLISSSGPVKQEQAMQVTPGSMQKAAFVYQSYLPVALPDTGQDGFWKLAALGLALTGLSSLVLFRRSGRKHH